MSRSSARYSPKRDWDDTQAVHVPARQRPRPQSRSYLRIIVLSFLLIFVLGTVAALAAGYFVFTRSDRVLPGVHVLETDIGFMPRAAAVAALQAGWQSQTIVLEHTAGNWPVAPDDLGMTLDADATVARALALGRTPQSVGDMLFDGLAVPPVWGYDPAMADATLKAVAADLNVAPVNAGVRIVNGAVETTPPADGYAVDIAASLSTLNANPTAVLGSGRLPLVTQTLAPTITDVTAEAEEARRLLATTVAVNAYDPVRDETIVWTLTPDVWGGWLRLETGADGASVWMLAQDAADAYFATQAGALGEARYVDSAGVVTAVMDAILAQQPGVTTRIYHYPTSHTVQAGESFASIGRDYGIPYPWLQQANPGVETLSVGQVVTIPSPDDLLPLPVVPSKRIVVSIAEQRVRAFENGQLLWDWPASTGIDSSPTSPGIFQIQTHELNAYAGNWDLWMPHFMGIYRPVPTSDFMNGFHGFPTRSGSQLLWTGDLGRKVTYGCVLVSSDNAAQLFGWAEEGVVVEVLP